VSIKIMTAVWKLDRKLASPTEKVVLLALADMANDDGACWPSLNTLADKTSLARSSVQRILSDLAKPERGPLLTWEQRRRKNGRQGCNLYFLTVGESPARLPEDPPTPEETDTDGGYLTDTDGGTPPCMDETSSSPETPCVCTTKTTDCHEHGDVSSSSHTQGETRIAELQEAAGRTIDSSDWAGRRLGELDESVWVRFLDAYRESVWMREQPLAKLLRQKLFVKALQGEYKTDAPKQTRVIGEKGACKIQTALEMAAAAAGKGPTDIAAAFTAWGVTAGRVDQLPVRNAVLLLQGCGLVWNDADQKRDPADAWRAYVEQVPVAARSPAGRA